MLSFVISGFVMRMSSHDCTENDFRVQLLSMGCCSSWRGTCPLSDQDSTVQIAPVPKGSRAGRCKVWLIEIILNLHLHRDLSNLHAFNWREVVPILLVVMRLEIECRICPL